MRTEQAGSSRCAVMFTLFLVTSTSARTTDSSTATTNPPESLITNMLLAVINAEACVVQPTSAHIAGPFQ